VCAIERGGSRADTHTTAPPSQPRRWHTGALKSNATKEGTTQALTQSAKDDRYTHETHTREQAGAGGEAPCFVRSLFIHVQTTTTTGRELCGSVCSDGMK